MNNAVKQFGGNRLYNYAIDELFEKADLLNVRFAKEMVTFETIFKGLHDLNAKVEKYLMLRKRWGKFFFLSSFFFTSAPVADILSISLNEPSKFT